MVNQKAHPAGNVRGPYACTSNTEFGLAAGAGDFPGIRGEWTGRS
jgi:hypothetical protein